MELGLAASIVGGVLAVWSGRIALGLQDPAFGLRSLWPAALLFAGVVAWIIVQSQVRLVAAWNHPLWEMSAAALGESRWKAISLDPFATVLGLARLLTYAGIFWIAFQYARRSLRARQILLAVVYAGLAYAVYGLVIYLTGSETILIFRKHAYLGDVTSTFVNRNSYATYAGLGLVCTTGLLLVLLTQGPLGPATDLKQRVARLAEIAIGRGWPLLLAWIALMTALVLSHSRAGVASTILGLIVLLTAAGLTRAIDRRFALISAGVCVVGFVWAFGVGGDQLIGRLMQTSLASEERPLVYSRTMAAIGDSGGLGTGLGTFEEAFRFYRTSDINGHFNMAHNTYLENVLELGVPAALALFGVFAFFLGLCAWGIRQRRRDSVYPCVGFAVSVLVATHATVDFSLQIPAVTATYMLIMGAACAQCWSSRRPADPW
ncbi:MAG: O-antigen ligase family protein [Rhodospirillales bacterium]|nr:O-antigen ligase family protein [Rhodospirillales bacterium]